ncbi:MAG: 23S rRNA (adenine(2030)-N(6))-methyltransferase RlmJ [Betaproteobacteria bacterium]
MFSYRHGFHAGNHADVLKHVVLVQLLQHLALKDKPFTVVDTHAGGGSYLLDAGFAAKSREFDTGIARLWSPMELPAALAEYVAQIRAFNPDGRLRLYPGSPRIAYRMLRPHDRLHAFELHTTEIRALNEHFRDADRRVVVHAEDGFAGLKALLPPPSRRGLVLIDPSYEDKADYRKVIAAATEALQRFATGIVAIWYPLVQRPESAKLPVQLQRMTTGDWLDISLTVTTPAEDGLGLHGSGVFVFNPPWKLEASLRAAKDDLTAALGQDATAACKVAFRQT